MTPAVTVVTDLKDSTLEMYGTCVHKVAETKTAYVDPVVHKVYDIKDSTTKVYLVYTGYTGCPKKHEK